MSLEHSKVLGNCPKTWERVLKVLSDSFDSQFPDELPHGQLRIERVTFEKPSELKKYLFALVAVTSLLFVTKDISRAGLIQVGLERKSSH